MMTANDFRALAAALKKTGATADTVQAVGDVCKASNARFDTDRFTAAAGITKAPKRSMTGEDRSHD